MGAGLRLCVVTYCSYKLLEFILWVGRGTADALIALDLCDPFFSWREAAVFPGPRWCHYCGWVE